MWKACMSYSNITGVFKGIAQCGYDFLTLQNFHLKNDVHTDLTGWHSAKSVFRRSN